MSSQDPRQFREADAVFDAALDLPADERRSFVEQRCANDSQLRDSVLALLEASSLAHDFLSRPAAEVAGPLLVDAALPLEGSTSLPARVGPFRMVRELGHGRMGTVFLGERDDEQFQQRVALKLIRPAAAAGGVPALRATKQNDGCLAGLRTWRTGLTVRGDGEQRGSGALPGYSGRAASGGIRRLSPVV